MYQLGVNAACTFVRTTLDELTTVEETGFLVDADAVNLQRIVENCLVEAVVRTHQNAIPLLIDGEILEDDDLKVEYETDKSITIELLKDTLRIASVSVEGCPVVSTLISEDSPEGRMQLNPYTRGVADDPRVVLAKVWKEDYQPILRFYSAEGTPKVKVEYIPYPIIENASVKISPRLEYAVLNELVAMVLDSVNEHNKATLYRAKSQAIMEGK